MSEKCELPEKASAGIRLAVEDLRKVMEDARYAVDMSVYHVPMGTTCAVCFAGVVMAETCKIPPELYTSPGSHLFSDETTRRLYALDSLRSGYVRDGVALWEGKSPTALLEIEGYAQITHFRFDPEEFIRDMLEMADSLEERGH